jgi:hypothetical protein
MNRLVCYEFALNIVIASRIFILLVYNLPKQRVDLAMALVGFRGHMFELASVGNGRIYTVSSCLANLERNSGVGISEAAKVGIVGLDEL